MFLELAILIAPLASDAHGGAKHELAPVPAIVWTMLTFVLVLIILWKFAWGPILEQLGRRETTIKDAIEGAQRERTEAEAARKKREEELANARGDGQKLIDEARDEASRVREDGKKAGEAARVEQVAAADREITSAKTAALSEVQKQAADLAMLIAGRVVGKSIDAKDHARLIEETLSKIEASS